ncbi:type II toxin-antitoxin system RelE family toxin [Serratia rubidaea]|uniref:type II toxin-antitoxin system RelE family toxin n=1 Tax=Serratia rubidaea TaxID=61652 RepID=UPI001BAF5904|nr:type II toxin-antitoxin system RelE/ParE family toxin [Serratia rubidaea]MBS0972674.1 type II toxin-antitoxin system RelE/ParE family toxin [Serratia rubidaea]
MVTVQWTKKATKQLISIDARYRKAIKEKVGKLITFPTVELDIKKLRAGDSQYRMRVGDYRVIFQIENGEPVICTIQEVKRRTSTTY